MSTEQKAQRTVHAWAAYEKKGEVKPYEFKLDALPETGVLVKISHCGICHSDIHLIDGDWGDSSKFPQVCGHEIVGVIEEAGKSVVNLKVGDRVGLGWNRKCCLQCDHCANGDEMMCEKAVPCTSNGQHGGFGDYIQVDESFAIKIPEKLSSAETAPLLCGGITVYSPIVDHSKPGDRVGVLGIGGLGHMAIKFARARGNHVVALSRGKDKAEYCTKIGADEYVDTTDKNAVAAHKGKLNLLIVTVFANVDYQPFIDMLANKGTICFVGASPQNVPVNIFQLVMSNIRITGSLTGGRKKMREMLDFAAINNIKCEIEVFPFEDVNKAIQKVRDNTIRFRAVLAHK